MRLFALCLLRPFSISQRGLFVMPEFRKNSLFTSSGLIPRQREVKAMLRNLVKLLSSLSFDHRPQQQFNGQLLDENREDVYALMQQQMSSLR
jgi:hypothetical protein